MLTWPAVRDVGARHAVPGAIHRARLVGKLYSGRCTQTVAASHGRRAFRLIQRSRGEKSGAAVRPIHGRGSYRRVLENLP